jgi:hypothetical protein
MIRRRVLAAWERVNHHLTKHPEPVPAPLTLTEQRLPRLHRVTRVALRFDLIWNTGEAVEHLEEFDREFLYHLETGCRDKAWLYTQAASQLEVQS